MVEEAGVVTKDDVALDHGVGGDEGGILVQGNDTTVDTDILVAHNWDHFTTRNAIVGCLDDTNSGITNEHTRNMNKGEDLTHID